LSVAGGINVTGVSFAGTPGGRDRVATTRSAGARPSNSIDVTDVFNEVLQAQIPGQPTIPTAITFEGSPEPLTVIPQSFRMNQVGNAIPDDIVTIPAGPPFNLPTATLVVPRRNNGPIVQGDVQPVVADALSPALSVAYTGWSATHEVDACAGSRALRTCRTSRTRCSSSTSDRRTGRMPTSMGTSRTTPAPNCRCVRISRPSSSPPGSSTRG
jgi:penicillin amidase